MGRKPNALILEFFERGAKLNDQSNRYQHTCRRCGEVFPKGRPDSLTRHLFEKCPKITEADRARALWQPAESALSALPHAQSLSSHGQHAQQAMNSMNSMNGMNGMNSMHNMASLDVEMLPFLPQREPSALDTLAEVSRQLQANGLNGADEAFMAQLQQHIDESDSHSVGEQSQAGASYTPSTTPPDGDTTGTTGTTGTSDGITHGNLVGMSNGTPHGYSNGVTKDNTNGNPNANPNDSASGTPDANTTGNTPTHVTEAADSSLLHEATNTVPLNEAETSVNEQLAEAAVQLSQSNAPRSRKRKASSAAGPDPTIPNSYLSYYPQRPPPAVDSHPHSHSAQHGQHGQFGLAGQHGQLQNNHHQHASAQPRKERDTSSQPADLHEDDHSPAFTINQGGFGLLQRANKSKARGRFSEDRRKEVQGVRKKGACLRCRMLKKPCSEGTPCNTCKNIESARLWKQACIRTRVADEFGLYSTTYFYSKDRAKVYASLNGVDPRNISGRIEVSLFPNHHLYGTFPALKTNRAGVHSHDFDPLVHSNQAGDAETADMFLLSFKTEDTLALKLERYMSAALLQCIARETSTIVRSTLELAAELSVEHDDDLLTKFVHLWTATNILVSKEPLWTIAYNPHHPPVVDHVTIVDETSDEGKASARRSGDGRIYFTPGTPDYDIMHAQLQDAAERYCQKQAKICLNELERRLLQRQQVPSFLTFLGAVILLNCVERMSALYYSFDPNPMSTTAEHTHAENESTGGSHPRAASTPEDLSPPAHTNNRPHKPDVPSDWPLQDPPSSFWPQGARFASLLQLLLRMRGLPPSIHIRNDGSLAILSNFNKAFPVEVTSNTEGGDSQQVLAAQWVERTGLGARELWRADSLSDADAGKDAWGDQGKGARAWDLRYTAGLLLP